MAYKKEAARKAVAKTAGGSLKESTDELVNHKIRASAKTGTATGVAATRTKGTYNKATGEQTKGKTTAAKLKSITKAEFNAGANAGSVKRKAKTIDKKAVLKQGKGPLSSSSLAKLEKERNSGVAATKVQKLPYHGSGATAKPIGTYSGGRKLKNY